MFTGHFRLSQLPRILLAELTDLAKRRNPDVVVVTRSGKNRDVQSVDYNYATNTVTIYTR